MRTLVWQSNRWLYVALVSSASLWGMVHTHFESHSHVDCLSFTGHVVVSIGFYAIINFVEKTKGMPETRFRLLFGLCLLCLSFFIVVLDNLYQTSNRFQQVGEVLFRVVGLVLCAIAVREWLGYNHQVHARLESSSNHAELTGLLNRRGFLKLAQKEMQRSKRYGHSLSLLSMDIDHFKSINDEFGHDVGDFVLSRFARLVSQNLRKNDLLCRWGGEEFLLLIPETSTRKSTIVAEKVRQSISSKPFNSDKAQLHTTVSIGCATVLPTDSDVFLAIKRADKALYRAKRSGRNRVC